MAFQPPRQLAPFYIERSQLPSDPAYNWQVQGDWFRIGLVPPSNNDSSDPGTGTMPTANALWFALRNVNIGRNNAVYLHFRASFTGEYDTHGAYEWRIARVAMKTVLDALTTTAVRDVRTGSGSWFDDYMRYVTDMPVDNVLTVRVKEVP